MLSTLHLPLLLTHAPTDRTPSDAGLEGVWDAVPVWGRLAVKLGVPISTVESLQQNPIGCLKASSYGRVGSTEIRVFPPPGPSYWMLLKRFPVSHQREDSRQSGYREDVD